MNNLLLYLKGVFAATGSKFFSQVSYLFFDDFKVDQLPPRVRILKLIKSVYFFNKFT
jgi:hypothetical protein